jgi:hypothetical protein
MSVSVLYLFGVSFVCVCTWLDGIRPPGAVARVREKEDEEKDEDEDEKEEE